MEYKAPKAGGGKMDMRALKAHNKLAYELPSNLNVVERRANKVSFADQNSYNSASGNEVVIRLTASTDYVYGKNSYLAFDVMANTVLDVGAAPTVQGVGFSRGTALSLFSRVLFEDRSGQELERDDRLNSYCYQVLPWTHCAAAKSTHMAMAGQQESGYPVEVVGAALEPQGPTKFQKNGSDAQYTINASKLTVCIPLRYFLGVFDRETLIPSMLTSGSLIRLQLAPTGQALKALPGSDAVSAASYTIFNPRVVLDSMSLAPVVQKNLMEQSQSGGGLDFVYQTRYYQGGNSQTAPSFNLTVNKAVSRCQKLFWSAHAQTTIDDFTNESLGTAQGSIAQLDYRLGNEYFPQRPITITDDAPTKNGAELYENSLQSVQRMRSEYDPPSITKHEFLTSGVPLDADAADNDNSGRHVHCQSFEQSSALEMSGRAINNSLTLEARINFVGTPLASQTLDAWILFVKMAKCSQLRCIVKE